MSKQAYDVSKSNLPSEYQNGLEKSDQSSKNGRLANKKQGSDEVVTNNGHSDFKQQQRSRSSTATTDSNYASNGEPVVSTSILLLRKPRFVDI